MCVIVISQRWISINSFSGMAKVKLLESDHSRADILIERTGTMST